MRLIIAHRAERGIIMKEYTIHGYRDFTKSTEEETIEAFDCLGVLIERASDSTVIPFYFVSSGSIIKAASDFDEAVEIANKMLDEQV